MGGLSSDFEPVLGTQGPHASTLAGLLVKWSQRNVQIGRQVRTWSADGGRGEGGTGREWLFWVRITGMKTAPPPAPLRVPMVRLYSIIRVLEQPFFGLAIPGG